VPEARRAGWELAWEEPATRLSLAVAVAAGLVSTVAVVGQAVALAHLLAGALPGAGGTRPADRPAWFALLGSAFALRAVATMAGEVAGAWGASSVKAALRDRLVAGVLRRAPAGEAGTGDVAAVAGRGLDALDVYVGRCLPDFVLAVLAPSALLAAAGVLDWLSALVMAVAVTLFPLFGALVGRTTMGLARDRWQHVEQLGRQATDLFTGLPELRSFGRSADERARMAAVNRALSESSSRALRVAFLSGLVLDTIGSVSVALVAVPLGLRLLTGSVHLSAALAVLVVAPEVFLPLRRASAEWHEATEGLAAAAKAASILGESGPGRKGGDLKAGQARTRPLPDPRDVPVALRSVSVVLPGDTRPVLDDASLVILPGETVVLTGPSGSGKTTVAALLLGFVLPTRGSVSVGDADLADLDVRRWRRLVTYLPERPTLLAATLEQNLRLASPDATDAELIAALHLAGADELACGLPGGLGTRLGEGGRPVSSGERQRIALARVLLRRASLYILDEPTAHLDEANRQTALGRLQAALAGRSALVISHDPGVNAIADRVVALRDGRFNEVEKVPA